MGQHCSCLKANKCKEKGKPSTKKSKLDSANLKNSTTPTICPPHFEIPSKKKPFDILKENADSIFPYNNSIAVSISDGLNIENLKKNVSLDDLQIFTSNNKKIPILESFFSVDKKSKTFNREFNYQEDLNKAKINVMEIFKKNEKGVWIEDLLLKNLCRCGEEKTRVLYSPKINKVIQKKQDVQEEIAP